MKTLIPLFILLSFFLLNSCDTEKPFDEIDPEIIPNFCDSTGTLKVNQYAEAYNLISNEWQLRIGDSARIANDFWLFRPLICKGLPDSLKEHELELIISYLDRSRIGETGLVSAIDLLSARRIVDFPEEDPRNSENMSTFYVKNDKGKNVFFENNLIFRNNSEWNEFLVAHPEAIPSRKIDFERYLLVAQSITHGGCGWTYKRSFNKTGEHKFVYKIKAEIYGGCQAGQRTYHWVTVPKVSEEDTVLFEFVSNFHPWPS